MGMHKDKGFRGTKFVMACIAMAVCALTFFATGYWPSLAGQYPILVGAVDALAALYMGGNAAAQYVAARHGKTIDEGLKSKSDQNQDPG